MDKTTRLEETIAKYKAYEKRAREAESFAEVDQAEKAAVSCLQLLQLQVVQAGDDFYRTAKHRRSLLRREAVEHTFHKAMGKSVAEVEKMVIAPEVPKHTTQEAPQETTKKTKKTTKKTTKKAKK